MAELSDRNNIKRKPYNSKSIQYKRSIILEIQDGGKLSYIAQREKISQSTVSTWWRNKAKILRDSSIGNNNPEKKRVKKMAKGSVDEALYVWFKCVRDSDVPINGPLLLSKANHLAEQLEVAPVNRSWIDRWKYRRGIRICSERIAGEPGSVSMENVNEWNKSKLKALIDTCESCNVNNIEEKTGLFYYMNPSTELNFEGQKYEGQKHSKDRLTLRLATDLDSSESDELPLLAVEKTAKPRHFKASVDKVLRMADADVTADDASETADVMTDADIVHTESNSLVTANLIKSDNDELCQEKSVPSFQEFKASLDVMRRYLEAQPEAHKHLANIHAIDNCFGTKTPTQRKLTDFWK